MRDLVHIDDPVSASRLAEELKAAVAELRFARAGSSAPDLPLRGGVGAVLVLAATTPEAVGQFQRDPSLRHIVAPAESESLTAHHLVSVLMAARQAQSASSGTLAFLGEQPPAGRRSLLFSSAQVEARLNKLARFGQSCGAGPRLLGRLRDIAAEMLSNAFYDAPFEGGALKRPPQRTSQVENPTDRPVEISYGSAGDLFFIRVRDSFGSLTRERLLEVLERCAAPERLSAFDESRGGAGLGLWQIFRHGRINAVSVVPGQFTDILVALPLAGGSEGGEASWHLLFSEPT